MPRHFRVEIELLKFLCKHKWMAPTFAYIRLHSLPYLSPSETWFDSLQLPDDFLNQGKRTEYVKPVTF